MNRVIINGDDFGLSESCTQAIAQALHEGLITDTTMTANGDAFLKAVALAQEEGFVDRIGIHFNITEGEPLTNAIRSCPDFVTDSVFHKNCDRSRALTMLEQDAVYHELCAQVERLRGAGIAITHADSHHYVHNTPNIAPIVMRVCREYGIAKLRLRLNLGEIHDDRAVIKAYNDSLREQGMITTAYFAKLREMAGAIIPDSTELLVHPDFDRDGVLIDRVGMADGYPVGEPIPDLRSDSRLVLMCYADLPFADRCTYTNP